MPTWSGMPGAIGPLDGPYADTPTGFLRELRSHRIVGSAGDEGSTMVYIDDEGKYRCFFQRWMATVDTQIFTNKADVRAWLKEWLPQERIAGNQ